MRLAQTAAGALVGLVVLAGCSSGQPANETLPSAAATSAEASETLPPLGPPDFPMPPEARQQTPAGAEAALRYYLDLVSRRGEFGGSPLRELSRDCAFCDFLANRQDEDVSAGYMVRGGQVTIEDLSAPVINGDVAEFALTLTQSAVTVVDAKGEPVEGRGEAERQTISVGASMTWSPQERAWVMNQLATS